MRDCRIRVYPVGRVCSSKNFFHFIAQRTGEPSLSLLCLPVKSSITGQNGERRVDLPPILGGISLQAASVGEQREGEQGIIERGCSEDIEQRREQ